MKSRRFLSIIAAAGMVWAAPLRAEDPSPADLAAMDDAQLAKAIADLSAKKDQSNDNACEMSLYLGERSRRQKTVGIDGQPPLLAGLCAASRNHWDVALVELTKAEPLNQRNATPEQRISLEGMLLVAAAVTKDKAAFETHLMHIAERGWPDEFRAAEPRLWYFGLNLMDVKSRDQVNLALARSAAFPSLPGELHDEIAAAAVHSAVLAGEPQLALRLAREAATPPQLLNMLIDRDYAPIWPELEALAGPHLQKSLANNLQKQRERAAKNPDDIDALSELVKALNFARDDAGAVAAAAKVDHSPAATEKWSESESWVLNFEVMALDRLGRRGEADALFDRLGTLSPENDRGWVVSFAINRAGRLASLGRWREALQASELALTVASDHGNGYAKESARSIRFCAASKLDPQRSELAGWWREIEQNWKDSVGAAVVAAMCKRDRTEARRLLVKGLMDPDSRENALKSAQSPHFSLYPDPGSMMPDPAELFAEDPKLREVLVKYGRLLPPEFMPN